MLSTSHFPHMPTQQTFWYAGNERGGKEKKQRVANVFDVNIICRGGEQDVWTISYQHSLDRKSTRLNSSHFQGSRMPSSAW
jgi:hypothetical protein